MQGPKVSPERLQELRLSQLDKHVVRHDLGSAALQTLIVVSLDGEVDARARGETEAAERFTAFRETLASKWFEQTILPYQPTIVEVTDIVERN